MSLFPKNWATFQHYKDRAPAWIKLHRGLLDDYEFSRLPVASRALAPLLWLLASEYESGEITATYPEIAFRLRMTEKDLIAAIKPLINKGFFSDASEVLADCYRDSIPEKEREIQEKIEEEKDIRAVAGATRPDDFDEIFWKEYPKRDGANPKSPARKKFLAILKSGVSAETIIAGVRRYRSQLQSKQQIGTPYVAQAVTWLNQQRWEDESSVSVSARSSEPPSPDLPSDEELRRKYGATNGRSDGVSNTAEAGDVAGREASDAGELLGKGPDADRVIVSGERADHPARNAGMRSLGDVLRKTPALEALGTQSAAGGEHPRDDGPGTVAGVVRH